MCGVCSGAVATRSYICCGSSWEEVCHLPHFPVSAGVFLTFPTSETGVNMQRCSQSLRLSQLCGRILTAQRRERALTSLLAVMWVPSAGDTCTQYHLCLLPSPATRWALYHCILRLQTVSVTRKKKKHYLIKTPPDYATGFCNHQDKVLCFVSFISQIKPPVLQHYHHSVLSELGISHTSCLPCPVVTFQWLPPFISNKKKIVTVVTTCTHG